MNSSTESSALRMWCSHVRASQRSLKAALALAVIAELPGDSAERDWDEIGVQSGSWRRLSGGTLYLSTGPTGSAGTAGSSSSSEWITERLSPRLSRFHGSCRCALASASRWCNRCFSPLCPCASDETRTTTWLHPRSGEPVNSGHMIRSGSLLTPLRFLMFGAYWAFIAPFASL